jgi:hypothetical protein
MHDGGGEAKKDQSTVLLGEFRESKSCRSALEGAQLAFLQVVGGRLTWDVPSLNKRGGLHKETEAAVAATSCLALVYLQRN